MSLDFIEKPATESEITIVENPIDDGRPVREGYISVTTTMPRAKFEKFNAAMHSDDWEKREELRKADLNKCVDSILIAMKWAMSSDCSGAATFARLLASLYNGNRVQMDASRLIFSLDSENFEHAMNVIRLCRETSREPHTFFVDGGALFEKMISSWRFEKKARARR